MEHPGASARISSSTLDKDRAEKLYRGNKWCNFEKFRNWRTSQNKTLCDSCLRAGWEVCTFTKESSLCDHCCSTKRRCSLTEAYRRAVFLDTFKINDATYDAWVADWAKKRRMQVQEKRGNLTQDAPMKEALLGSNANDTPRTTQAKGPAPPVVSRRIGEGVERKPAMVELKGIPKKHLGTIELTDSDSDSSFQPPPKRLRQAKHARANIDMSGASRSRAMAASSNNGRSSRSDSDDASDSEQEGQQTDDHGDESWNEVMQDILTLINQTRDPKSNQSHVTAFPNPKTKTHQSTVLGKRKERFADLDYSDSGSEDEEPSISEVRDRALEDAIIFHKQRLKILRDRRSTEERAKGKLAKQFRVIEKDVQKNLSECQRRMQKELEAVIRDLKQDGEASVDASEGPKKRKEL